MISCNPTAFLNLFLNYGYTRSFIRNCKQSALSNCQRNSMITGCQPCRSEQCRMCFYTRSTAIVISNLHSLFLLPKTRCNAQLHLHDSLHSAHIPTKSPRRLMMPVSASDSLMHPKFFLCFYMVDVGTGAFVLL